MKYIPLLFLLLAGCTSIAETQATSEKTAQEYCQAKGKTFLLSKTIVEPRVFYSNVYVSGVCE